MYTGEEKRVVAPITLVDTLLAAFGFLGLT